MARIPTYTAEGGLPAGGTGPQASPAAYAAPARALGNLGETIAQTGGTLGRVGMGVAEMMEKRQEQDDAFWATKQSETLHREFYDYLQANKDSENLNSDFLNFSSGKIQEAAKSAPSPKAGKILEAKIGDNVTTLYKSASAISFLTKESNRIEESKAAAQNIGTMIQSVPDLFRPDVVQTSKTLVQQRLDAIDSLSYGSESKRKIKSAFLVETILSSAAASPEFAMSLTENQVFDEAKKIQLRREIESLQKAGDAAAVFNYENGPKGKMKEVEAITTTGIPVNPPPRKELDAIYGDKAPLKEAQFNELYRVANTTVSEFNKVKGLPYDQQLAQLSKVMDPKDPDVYRSLGKMLEKSKDDQEKRIGTWMLQNNKEVQDLFAVAYGTPIEGGKRFERLTAARQKMLQYQGSPEDPKSPDADKYHNLPRRMWQVMSQSEAEDRAAKINGMSDQALANYMDQLAIEYPDDNQRAIAWNNMVTLPKNGIQPEIQLAQMITDPVRRVNVIGIMRNEKYIKTFPAEQEKEFEKELNKPDNKFGYFMANLDPTFNPQRPELSSFYTAILSYSKRVAAKTPNISPKEAVAVALNHLVSDDDGKTGPWYFTESINGQKLAIQAARDDLGRKPGRTSADVLKVGEQLRAAINQLPIDQLLTQNPNGAPIFSGSELLVGEEKNKFIKNAIRSQGFWVTNENGQGAQLYLRGRDMGIFPVRDKKGNIFEVDYDEIQGAMIDPYSQMPQGPVIPYGETQIQGAYMQSSAMFPTSRNITAVAVSPTKLDSTLGNEFTLNVMSRYWKNLRKPNPETKK